MFIHQSSALQTPVIGGGLSSWKTKSQEKQNGCRISSTAAFGTAHLQCTGYHGPPAAVRIFFAATATMPGVSLWADIQMRSVWRERRTTPVFKTALTCHR